MYQHLRFAPLLALVLLLPAVLFAQLRELEITPDTSPGTIPVFPNYPEHAAVIINSSIANLQFTSTLDIIADLSEPASGRYILIIPASRQSIRVSAPNYIAQSFSVGAINARDVRYFRVEPKQINITETGTLIVRTNPTGATLTLDGVPGSFTSPHTFTNILAQGYTLRISLTDYEEEVMQVGVSPERPNVQTIELIPTFGFITITTPNATLFLQEEGTDIETRRTYTPGQPLRLDVGRYAYRLSRPEHADATGTFEITPNTPVTISPQLESRFGLFSFARIQGGTLFVAPEEGGTETRYSGDDVQEYRLPMGNYRFRAEREFYIPATGSFSITPEQRTHITPELQPAYGTLIVEANVPVVQLRASDNSAPPNRSVNQLFLEQGRRMVTVSAPGYVEQELDIRMQPGETLRRSVTLESIAERDERLRREELPRGVLQISADVDAQIWVNGQQEGTGSVVLTLIPDRYNVELRHAVGRTSFLVDVAPADFVERFVEMRPSRATAIRYAIFVPGGGHLYRKDARGYAYLALVAGAAVYTFSANAGYTNELKAYNETQEAYRRATNTATADALREQLLSEHKQLTNTRLVVMTAGALTAGLYAAQLLDVALTNPRYGYRGSQDPRVTVSVDGVGLTLRASF